MYLLIICVCTCVSVLFLYIFCILFSLALFDYFLLSVLRACFIRLQTVKFSICWLYFYVRIIHIHCVSSIFLLFWFFSLEWFESQFSIANGYVLYLLIIFLCTYYPCIFCILYFLALFLSFHLGVLRAWFIRLQTVKFYICLYINSST